MFSSLRTPRALLVFARIFGARVQSADPLEGHNRRNSPSITHLRFGHLLPTALVGGVFLVLAWRLHRFVDGYAVNLLSWDQWDLYLPLFRGEGWWASFVYQHGPHRQGVGGILSRALAEWSGWNTRMDALSIVWTLIISAMFAWWLARRCGVKASLAWVAIPLIFFNARQNVTIIGAANLSHGAMPVLLVIAFAAACFVSRYSVRLMLFSGLTFLVIFTGFGLFLGLLTPLVLVFDGVHAVRKKQWRQLAMIVAAMGALTASWLVFAETYTFQPAVSGFRFPYEKPWEYVEFAGLMLANFFGMPGHGVLAIAVGLVALVGLAAVAAWHGLISLGAGPVNAPTSTVISCLALFSILFCANTAVGRVFLGLEGAPAVSRYVTLIIPGALAIFLHLATLSSAKWAARLALIYALLLVPGTTVLRKEDWHFARIERDGRLNWRAAYLETRDESIADRHAGFRVYPISVKPRLDFLEERKLNLFAKRGRSSVSEQR